VQEVFNYVSDVGNYPRWMAHVLEVRKDTPGPPQQGDRFTVAIKSVGRRFETPYERSPYEANRCYTDRAVGGPVPNHRWHCTFEDVPRGTRLTRTVDAEPGGLLKLLEPLQNGQPAVNFERTFGRSRMRWRRRRNGGARPASIEEATPSLSSRSPGAFE
jgi:hypothetical protein